MPRKSKRRSWTSSDVRTLKTMARKKTRAASIARTLKRTEGATRQKAFSLGLSLELSVTRLDEIKSPAAVRGFFVAGVVTGLVSLPTDGLKQGAFLWNYATDRTSRLQHR